MKKYAIILFLLISTHYSAFSQDFDAIGNQLSTQLSNVKSNSYEYQQKVINISPGVLSFVVNKIDSHGKSHTTSYEVNLADIDKSSVKPVRIKDLITIHLQTKDKKKLIKMQSGDNNPVYVSGFKIYGKNMHNGSELSKTIKNGIPIAKDIVINRLSFRGFNDRLKWIISHVGNVSYKNKQINQKITTKQAYPGAIVLIKNIISGKKEKEIKYLLHLSTLDPKQIDFDIKTNEVALKLVTKNNQKLITALDDKNEATFTDHLSIACNNIEEARDLKRTLAELTGFSKKKFEKSLIPINELEKGYKILNSLVENTQNKTTKYIQNFKGNCTNKYTLKSQTRKKETVESFEFNWKDLKKESLRIKIKNQNLAIEIKTRGGKKFIKHSVENKPDNFINKMYIYVPSIENALIFRKTINEMISICKKTNKNHNQNGISIESARNILLENVHDFESGKTSYEQKIEFTDSQQLEYSVVLLDEKSIKDYVYKVNIGALDPNSVRVKVKGDRISVEVKTYSMLNDITVYKDDDFFNMKNKLEIMAPDVETARKIKKALMRILTK